MGSQDQRGLLERAEEILRQYGPHQDLPPQEVQPGGMEILPPEVQLLLDAPVGQETVVDLNLNVINFENF